MAKVASKVLGWVREKQIYYLVVSHKSLGTGSLKKTEPLWSFLIGISLPTQNLLPMHAEGMLFPPHSLQGVCNFASKA